MEGIPLDHFDHRNYMFKPQPVESTVDLPLFHGDSEQCTKIGSLVQGEQKQELVEFLKNNTNVFAWSVVDMLRILSSVILHSLNVSPTVRPIR